MSHDSELIDRPQSGVHLDEKNRKAWDKVQALVLSIDPKLIDDLADYEISIELSTEYRRAHLRPMKPIKG